MRYYKEIKNGYISAIGTGVGNVEITQDEYAEIMSVIQSKPVAETGYDYRLRTDLTWELVEAPIVEDDAEATEADYLEALERLGVSE